MAKRGVKLGMVCRTKEAGLATDKAFHAEDRRRVHHKAWTIRMRQSVVRLPVVSDPDSDSDSEGTAEQGLAML